MELYIGGKAQGKLNYVLTKYNIELSGVFDNNGDIDDGKRIWNNYQDWFCDKLKEGKEPEELTRDFVKRNKDIIIISDEVGCGIVPIEKNEREYRERIGRMLCELAENAKKVERVICGLGQRIK